MNDIYKIHSFAIYHPYNFKGVLNADIVRVDGVFCFRLTRKTLDALPELKQYVSLWHLLFDNDDILIITTRVDKNEGWFDTLETWKNYYDHFPREIKGYIRYSNVGFIITVPKRSVI